MGVGSNELTNPTASTRPNHTERRIGTLHRASAQRHAPQRHAPADFDNEYSGLNSGLCVTASAKANGSSTPVAVRIDRAHRVRIEQKIRRAPRRAAPAVERAEDETEPRYTPLRLGSPETAPDFPSAVGMQARTPTVRAAQWGRHDLKPWPALPKPPAAGPPERAEYGVREVVNSKIARPTHNRNSQLLASWLDLAH